MEAEDIVRANLKLAFSSQRSYILQFAGRINAICPYFKQDFIVHQFIPFLTNWYDSNDAEVGILLSTQLRGILDIAQSVLYMTPFLKVLILSENKEINHNILSFLSNLKGSLEMPYLIANFNNTYYDPIRAFSPKIIDLIATVDQQKEMLTPSLKDISYMVKYAVLSSLKNYSPELAQYATEYLLKDANGKIRQYIPAATYKFDFFPTLVLPSLKQDYEWTVRAAVAIKAGSYANPELVFNDLIELFNDNTWEVKLNVIRAFTNIFTVQTEKRFDQYEQYITQLILYSFVNLVQSLLGNATIDLVLALMVRGDIPADSQECTGILSTIITIEISSIWTHFMKHIFAVDPTPYVPFLGLCFKQLIDKIARSKKWRDREMIIEYFPKFLTLFPGEETSQYLLGVASAFCTDEAFPVREKAAAFIAYSLVQSDATTIHEYVLGLGQSQSYRDRQVSLQILVIMYKLTQNEEFKNVILAEIEKFKNDPYDNVRELAISLTG